VCVRHRLERGFHFQVAPLDLPRVVQVAVAGDTAAFSRVDSFQMPPRILVSAGEASGDLYAALLVEELRRQWPAAEFFGCTGPRMRAAGVRTVVDSSRLAVVGLAEVAAHIPRIWREFRKLRAAARKLPPDLAILTDAPDFHLRLAPHLRRAGIPVVYLVAPQVWAWRKGRLPLIRRTVSRLLCIYPFEEEYFRSHRVEARYIGHPLAGLAKPALTRDEFLAKHGLPSARPLVALLPGSRRGEALRHLPVILDTVARLARQREISFVLPASATTGKRFFLERIGAAPIQVIEGECWDAMAHADLALGASGTVTTEAALLGTPMVVFYKVAWPTYWLGRLLVKVPFYSMVNLVAGRRVVPELIQADMTGERLAAEATRLLDDAAARERMRRGLAEVRERLTAGGDPMVAAAAQIREVLEGRLAHVS
jgi:lipid-A-disaccharide synthase